MTANPEELDAAAALEAQKKARNEKIMNRRKQRMALIQNTDEDNVEMPPEFYESLRRERQRQRELEQISAVPNQSLATGGPASLFSNAGGNQGGPELQHLLTSWFADVFSKSTALPRWVIILFTVMDHLLRLVYLVLSTARFCMLAQENQCYVGEILGQLPIFGNSSMGEHVDFSQAPRGLSLAKDLWEAIVRLDQRLCSKITGFRLFWLSEASFFISRAAICYITTRRLFSIANKHVRRGFVSRCLCVLVPMAIIAFLCNLN